MGEKLNNKILFIMGGVCTETTPNGVCVKAVVNSLLQNGNDVHILSMGDPDNTEWQGIHIHSIPYNLFLRMRKYGEQHPQKWYGRLCYRTAMLLNKIQKLVLLPWYPLNHPGTVVRFYKKAERLQKEHGFDRVIGVYCPLEAMLASLRFKKHHLEIPMAIYVLDSLIYMSGSEYFPKQVADWLKWRLEKKVYEGADMVYNMRCHECHHVDAKYDPYRPYMRFLDIPLFEPLKDTKSYERLYDTGRIQWVYMGTLFENYREPYYMCKLADALVTEGFPVQIQFYTRGSCEDKIADMSKHAPELYVQHGYVSNELQNQIYDNADFLINIGVNKTTMISSKVFSYMAFGKPVIHFYYQDDDVNNPYLEKYPLCCLIQMKDELFEENRQKLRAFLTEVRGKRVDSSQLLDTFKENIPAYTAKEFENYRLRGKT